MASAKELVTKIILKGQADPSLQRAFNQANKMSDGAMAKMQKYGQTVKKVAKAGAVAVGAGLVSSAKSAIDYESAFAGVMKTVEETGTTSYDKLSKSIIDMSKKMPASAVEIANVASSAGQLGIKADDIMTFTETMINLGETTNLSSEEAASSIAKMFNIMGTNMKDVDKFGATIVALGNNAATTESDIVNMASRIAAGGVQIGLTESEILALSTTLSSVGLEAEGGGTAISTVMAQIDKDVAKNSETLGTWAELAGMSTKKFSKLWSSDAYGALTKVIGGMGDATKGGENMNLILEDLGINGIRTTDTMKRLSNASKLMGDMTNLANTAWGENTALTNEANVRYNTLASKLQMAKNKIVAFGISVGNQVMPYINKLLDAFNKIDFDAVAQKIGNAINWIAEHSTTIVAVIGTIAGAMAGFKIAGFIMTLYKVGKTIVSLVKGFGLLKVAFAFLGGPVGIVLGLIGALVGGFVALWMKSEKFRNFWKGLWNGIKNIAHTVGSALVNFFTVTLPNGFNKMIAWCRALPSKIGTFFSNMGSKMKTATMNAVNAVVNWFKNLPSRIWTWLVNLVAKIETFRLNMLAKAKSIGMNFVNAVVNFFKTLPYKIGYFIGMVIGKIATWAVQLWQWAKTTGVNFVKNVINFFRTLPSKIWTWLVNTVNKVIAWGSRMVSIGIQKATAFVKSVVNFFKTLPSKVWTWLVNTVNKVISWGARMVSLGRQKAMQFINAVINFFKTLPSKVWSWLVKTAQKVVAWGTQLASKGKAAAIKLYNAVVNKVKEIPKKMLSIGKDIAMGLKNGIVNAIGNVKDGVKKFCSGVKDGFTKFFKISSPSKLTTGMGGFIGQGVGVGIQKSIGFVNNKVSKFNEAVKGGIGAVQTKVSPVIGKVQGKLPKFGDGGRVTSPMQAIVGDTPETIVPDGNTPRNRGLLQEAARRVGVKSIGGNQINITFAPVVHGGNAEENRKMLQEEEAEFERKMDAYFAKKGRLAF